MFLGSSTTELAFHRNNRSTPQGRAVLLIDFQSIIYLFLNITSIIVEVLKILRQQSWSELSWMYVNEARPKLINDLGV